MYCQVDAMMTETNSVVSVKYYSCCSEPYPDLTFTVSLRRVAAFYNYTVSPKRPPFNFLNTCVKN